MDKTIHRKFTERQLHSTFSLHTHENYFRDDEHVLTHREINLIHDLSEDLLQPRQEAVTRLLQMAKGV